MDKHTHTHTPKCTRIHIGIDVRTHACTHMYTHIQFHWLGYRKKISVELLECWLDSCTTGGPFQITSMRFVNY